MAKKSSCFPLSLLIATSILTFLPLSSSSSQSPLNSFVYGGCSQLKYTPNSPYESNLNSLITSLVNSATYSSYNRFATIATNPHDVIYGLYQCRGDLSMPDCASCIANSVSQLAALCHQSCGGSVQLQGCFIQYDNATFFGEEDKTVVYKKCGPSVGYDAERISGRDAMLNALVSGETGGPYYKVGGSKEVQGLAQCVGDLSSAQCEDCLGEAVRRLKSECGTAENGDVFLGKCYVRYTVGGTYASSTPSKGSSKNQLGIKTFALIIGLLAGIVILIIFLTFLCRVFLGSGK